MIYSEDETMKTECLRRRIPLIGLAVLALLLLVLAVTLSNVAATDDDDSRGRLVIRSRTGGEFGISRAELSRRPAEGALPEPSRRPAPPATDPYPTILRLTFPTLVEPGEEVRGTLKFNDPDDYVVTIYITVFFPDGDVVTEVLYDYFTEGGDVYKGKYTFWVLIPESETPLRGRIIITASDEYLNVSEVSTNYALIY